MYRSTEDALSLTSNVYDICHMIHGLESATVDVINNIRGHDSILALRVSKRDGTNRFACGYLKQPEAAYLNWKEFHDDQDVPDGLFLSSFEQLSSTVKENPNELDFIVISGDDEKEGQALGEYHLLRSDANQIIYQQSTTEQPAATELKFIYFIEDSGWWVGEKVGNVDGWFFNPSLSKTLPLSGWKYKDGFKDDNDRLLYIANDGAWMIGPKLFWYNLRSKSGANIPLSSDDWQYWDGIERKVKDTDEVTVSCKPFNPDEGN